MTRQTDLWGEPREMPDLPPSTPEPDPPAPAPAPAPDVLPGQETLDPLDSWLAADIPAGQCPRCGVELLPHEMGECDDCAKARPARQERQPTHTARTRPGRPVWSDTTVVLPDPDTMPEPMQAAYIRQQKRYGEATLYCSVCRLPSGRYELCYPCKVAPERVPGTCQTCGGRCRPEYLTCWGCR